MAIKNWDTQFEGANPIQDADPITNVMPDLDDESAPGASDGDWMLSSQVEAMRDKLQAACKLLGDSVNDPSGSIAEIIDRDHANGDALQVRFGARAVAPATSASHMFIFALNDGGVIKPYVLLSDGTVKPIDGQTNTVSGANGITNTGDNIDAVLEPTYGSAANTVCEGDDARLSDSRTPTGPASGDLTGTYPGPTIDADAVDNTKLANMAESTVKGRAVGAGTGDPVDLTSTQLTAILNAFTDALQGAVPASGGGTINFLRADGTWVSSVPVTTKGDICTYGTVADRLPVGTDGQIVRANSASSVGLEWSNEQKAHEDEYTASASGNIDIDLDYVPYGSGALGTPSGYDILAFRDGVKMTYAAVPSASNEYWYNSATNEVRVVGDGSSHKWEIYYRSIQSSPYTAGGATFGTTTFGTGTFDG